VMQCRRIKRTLLRCVSTTLIILSLCQLQWGMGGDGGNGNSLYREQMRALSVGI